MSHLGKNVNDNPTNIDVHAPQTSPSISIVLTRRSISFISVSSSQGLTSISKLDLAITAASESQINYKLKAQQLLLGRFGKQSGLNVDFLIYFYQDIILNNFYKTFQKLTLSNDILL